MTNADGVPTITIQIPVVGSMNSGKTSILHRIDTGHMPAQTLSTIGMDLVEKHMQISTDKGEVDLHIRFWDTAGQERFRSAIGAPYRRAGIVFVVFDITKVGQLEYWLKDARDQAPEGTPIVLIGNKIDLVNGSSDSDNDSGSDNDPVDLTERSGVARGTIAQCWREHVFFTSAKSGDGMAQLIGAIVEHVTEKVNSSSDQNIFDQPSTDFSNIFLSATNSGRGPARRRAGSGSLCIC